MANVEQVKAAIRERGLEWPIGIILFFILVFMANGVLVYLANSSWNGVVTTDHYQKGLAYDQVLAAQARQEALGWQGELTPRFPGGQRVEFAFSLRDRDSAPLEGGAVTILLFRPTLAGHDREVTLREEAPGRYTGGVAAPLPGWWEVRLSAVREGESYRMSHRIQVPKEPPGLANQGG